MLERMANFQTETSKKISHKFQKRTSMALEEIDVKMGENKIETGRNKNDLNKMNTPGQNEINLKTIFFRPNSRLMSSIGPKGC